MRKYAIMFMVCIVVLMQQIVLGEDSDANIYTRLESIVNKGDNPAGGVPFVENGVRGYKGGTSGIRLVGTYKMYSNHNNVLHEIGEYDSDGIKIGSWYDFDFVGNHDSIVIEKVYRNGTLIKDKWYNKEGNIIFKDDKLNDAEYRYYENGKVFFERVKAHKKVYFPDGKIQIGLDDKDNLKVYAYDGSIIMQRLYTNGERNGTWKEIQEIEYLPIAKLDIDKNTTIDDVDLNIVYKIKQTKYDFGEEKSSEYYICTGQRYKYEKAEKWLATISKYEFNGIDRPIVPTQSIKCEQIKNTDSQ